MDFATHPSFCGSRLYPRQHTLLKLMFLETEQMSDYDLEVIEGWRGGFTRHRDVFGVQPDIWERIAYLKSRGARRFPHIQFIGGRRGSKGLMGGILGTEQLAYFHTLDDWQRYYGVDAGKDGYLNIGATSQTQAKDQLFADIRSTVERCQYLHPYIAETKDHILSVRTPADIRRIGEMKAAGVPIDHLVATLKVQALSSQSAAGRGATAFGIMLDEFAFMLQTGSAKSGDAIYEDWAPSLDQFDLDGLMYVPSSPYTRAGRCYSLYQQGSVLMSSYTDREGGGEAAQEELKKMAAEKGTELDEVTADPTMLIVHLPSWGAYEDWERGPELVGIKFKRPIQPGPGHESQRRRKLRNPEKFQVERCLDPDTRVLCADYTWRRIDDLKVGDELVGFDEEAEGKGVQRKMRTSVVRAKFDSFQAAYRIVFDDGTSVTCSADHRWLSTKATERQASRWRKIAPGPRGPRTVLGVGDSIRFVAEPWEADTSYEAGYLAGFMDGEGTLQRGGGRGGWQLSWAQLPGEVSDEVIHLLKEKDFEPVLRRDSDPLAGQWHEKYQRTRSLAQAWAINGFAECARFLGSVGGVKLRRQAGRMWEGKALPRPHQYGRCFKQIVAIEELPPQRLVDIETTTSTFIAEGFASHNSAQWAEVMGAYFDSDMVDRIFHAPTWRAPLEAQGRGYLDRKYRIHCDPGRTGANFALCIGHTEDMCPTCGWTPQQLGQALLGPQRHPQDCPNPRMRPHVVIDLLHVWQPKDFPPDPETGKPTIDYVQVREDIEGLLRAFPSTTKISFDQWNSAGMIAELRRSFSPGIRVAEVTFTEKENQSRCEKVKSALNLGWISSYADTFGPDGSCLLEQEMKYLSVRAGKVVKQSIGPIVTKDLFDAFAVVVTDLLHNELERYGSGGDSLSVGVFGSTNVAALQSGREQNRIAAADKGNSRAAENRARLASFRDNGRPKYVPSRASSIRPRRG